MFDSFYSLVIHLQSQSEADKLYNAFNGRFFSEECHGETMHTVFLSEPVLMKHFADYETSSDLAEREK